MLEYINQLLHYIIDLWIGPIASGFLHFSFSNSLLIFIIAVPVSISILFLAVKIIRKFIWGAK